MDLLTTVLLIGVGVVAGMLASIVGGAAVVVYPALIASAYRRNSPPSPIWSR